MRQPATDRPGQHFLLAGDHRVAWGIAAAVGSVLTVLPPATPASVTVVDGGLPSKVRDRLHAGVAASGKAIRLRFAPFSWPAGCAAPALEGSLLNYARLFAPELVEGSFCLYLDADVVLGEDPAPLFAAATAAPGVPVWAARNYPEDSFIQQIGRQAPALTEGVAAGTRYFNNGVLLINLAAWRQRGIGRQALALAETHRFISHEQDALNVLLRDEWRELPERWNHQLYGRREFPAGERTLHYSGRNKPWHYGYPATARAPFLTALAAAGWPGWSPRPSVREWLRNSSWQPRLAQWHFRVRRWSGLEGIKRR